MPRSYVYTRPLALLVTAGLLLPVLPAIAVTPAAAAIASVEPETPPESSPENPETAPYVVETVTANAIDRSLDETEVLADQVDQVYTAGYTGFAAELTDEQVADLEARSDVVAVTRDVPVHISETEVDATWGLDRIDQRDAAGDGLYSYGSTGTGVTAFVIDSGIRMTHEEFDGRAESGWDYVDDDDDASDCNGHGTHVAGTIGGETYGVAKDARLVALRVFDCAGSGWSSDFIAALDWAISHKPAGPAVVNFSGGGPSDEAIHTAVRAAVEAGLIVVVAAGNDNDDACLQSPASAPDAVTVGATDSADGRAYFSNFGTCIDLFAPGVNIASAIISSDFASGAKSGTSMAAPHVAGIAARLIEENAELSATSITEILLSGATPGAVSDPRGSPNLLAYIAPSSLLDLTATPTPTISGTPKLDETLTVTAGLWSPAPVPLTLQWMRDGSPIPYANKSTYKLTVADVGASISVTVTGDKPGYASVTRTSATTYIPANTLTSTPTPTISGTVKVGETLSVTAGAWKPSPVALDLQWKRNGVAIPFAVKSTYKLTSEDVGTSITVSVTGTKPGYTTVTNTSTAKALPFSTLTTAPIPTISGTVKVGGTLSATAGLWKPSPVGLDLQWKRDGSAIPYATKSTYTLTTDDIGAAITVSVTGTKVGYAPVTKTSAAKTLPFSTLTGTPTPTISGTLAIGSTVSATAGLWTPSPVSLDLQWKRDGVPLAGETKATYVLAVEDAGKAITVSVTGTKPGYASVTKTSAAKTLPFSTLTNTPTPTISGTPSVGQTLDVTAGLWQPSPVSLALQWKRNGVSIPGATKSSYLLDLADQGASITVSVTGSKPGYASVTRTSAGTTLPLSALTSTPIPTVSGTLKVGQTLSVTAGLWQPSPVPLDLQWKRNGVAISGATKSTYKLTSKDAGKTITVSVTGTKTGYASVTKTSAGKSIPK